MEVKPILVVMAAGMGSRYGGLKQLDPVDEYGHIIMDFSIFDAVRAGFGKIVFIIKRENESDFRNKIISRLEHSLQNKGVEIEVCFQELDRIPYGKTVPEGRVKPWGTAHAVLCAAPAIDAPFAVVNADDYYGPAGFKLLADFLKKQAEEPGDDKAHYAMVGFELGKTVTDNGYVSRGVCEVSDAGYLESVTERVRIEKRGVDEIAYTEDDGASWHRLEADRRVSMNLWGFTEDFLGELRKGFASFLETTVPGNPLKAEYYLPFAVSGMLERGEADVTVLPTPDKWYGVTYREDKPQVEEAVRRFKAQGIYPDLLFPAVIPDAYKLIDRQFLPDAGSVGYLLEHKKSGARIVLMDNADDNKTFYIAFRTPPTDSTGVAHIMEHSVLCGSENFPLKDPFVELGKGSLNTFLNAMTYPDKTVYPIASCNDADFRNLMHVYMDAVFHPLIYRNEQIFRQEGWHYELSGETENLSVNGVVYNEMKGVFSSPEGVLDYAVMNSLFPDTGYGYESGGDPDAIPDLTYEAFMKFHRTYYHPSNSYIYLYGQMDFTERLNWLDENYLSHYDRIEVTSQIGEQKPFNRMSVQEIPFALPSGTDPSDQAYLSWSKVVGTVLDEEMFRAFQVLDYALLSSSGAPLKKALIEAGIGQDVSGGYDCGIYQPMFSVTAKQAGENDLDRFAQIIDQTLREQAEHGVDIKALEAALNTMRFSYIEGDSGRTPKGLIWGLSLLESWLYDDSKPFLHAHTIEVFDRLKEKIGTSYFEDLIRTWLIDNEHGSLILLKGDPGRAERLEESARVRMQEKKAAMSPADLQAVLEGSKALLEYQNREDTPEVLAKIPVLELSDIRRESEPLINEEVDCRVPFIFHETDTKGIAYVNLLFDMSGLSGSELALASVLTRSVLGQIDTDQYTYEQFGHEVDRTTGGLAATMTVRTDLTYPEREKVMPAAEIHLKGFYDQMGAGFELIREMLLHAHLRDGKRLREILAEDVSRMQLRVLTDGHTLAAGRALAYQSAAENYKDRTSGIAFYRSIRALLTDFDAQKEQIMDALEGLCRKIYSGGRMTVSLTAQREALESVRMQAEALAQDLAPGTAQEQDIPALPLPEGSEGFATAGQIQYVARGGNFLKSGHTFTGAMDVLSAYLRWEYLWQNVRVRGGAYGCMTGFRRSGNTFFVSYRDPHLKRTWDVFGDLPDTLEKLELSERELRQYIIGAINSIDQPLTPRSRGARSLALYLSGITKEMLDEQRKQILETDCTDLRALADVVRDVLDQDYTCTIGSEAKVREHADLFDTTEAL